MSAEDLKDRILKIITMYNMKQKEFAKYVEVTPQHISKILNGSEQPSKILLQLICERFNIRDEWLIHGKGKIFKSNEIDKFSIVVYLFKQLDKKHQDFAMRFLKDLVDTETKQDDLDSK